MSHIGSDPRGRPRWRGRPPGSGRPRDEGVPKDTATLPGDGVPRDAGRAPTSEGVVLPGSPGQVPKGTPGTMEPWMENPWAPGALDDAWTSAPPPVEDDDDDAFYRSHPNYLDRGKTPRDDEG